MRKAFYPLVFLLVPLALVVAQPAKPDAAKKLTPAEAKEAAGKYATVVAKVVQVRAQEKVTHINFEKPYPYHTFTAVVFASKTNLFPELDKLVAKTVEVSGKIEVYNDKPQIVLVVKSQLKVVEEREKNPAEGKPEDGPKLKPEK